MPKEKDRRPQPTALATKTTTALAGKEDVPDYLRRADGQPAAGTENMDRSDMALPRLGLCQSLSPQRKKQNPKYIPGLEEGQFFNTLTREIYGSTLNIVPLHFYKTRIRFGDIEKGGGILCQAQDNKHGQGDPGGLCQRCPLSAFKDGEPPECTQFMNYAALVLPKAGKRVEMDALLVASFKSTGLKIAREWNSLIRIKNLDIFAGIYTLTSTEANNASGQSWYQPTVAPAGLVSREMYEFAKEAYQGVRERSNLDFDVTDLQEEGREPGDEVEDKDSEV